MAAAAIGGGLADILTAPIWAPATIIIKALISIPFTNKSSKIVTAGNVISTIIAFVISATGYAIAEAVITQTNILVVLPASVPGSVIQSGGSAIIFIILGLVLDKMGFKKRFFQSGGLEMADIIYTYKNQVYANITNKCDCALHYLLHPFTDRCDRRSHIIVA